MSKNILKINKSGNTEILPEKERGCKIIEIDKNRFTLFDFKLLSGKTKNNIIYECVLYVNEKKFCHCTNEKGFVSITPLNNSNVAKFNILKNKIEKLTYTKDGNKKNVDFTFIVETLANNYYGIY